MGSRVSLAVFLPMHLVSLVEIKRIRVCWLWLKQHWMLSESIEGQSIHSTAPGMVFFSLDVVLWDVLVKKASQGLTKAIMIISDVSLESRLDNGIADFGPSGTYALVDYNSYLFSCLDSPACAAKWDGTSTISWLKTKAFMTTDSRALHFCQYHMNQAITDASERYPSNKWLMLTPEWRIGFALSVLIFLLDEGFALLSRI